MPDSAQDHVLILPIDFLKRNCQWAMQASVHQGAEVRISFSISMHRSSSSFSCSHSLCNHSWLCLHTTMLYSSLTLPCIDETTLARSGGARGEVLPQSSVLPARHQRIRTPVHPSPSSPVSVCQNDRKGKWQTLSTGCRCRDDRKGKPRQLEKLGRGDVGVCSCWLGSSLEGAVMGQRAGGRRHFSVVDLVLEFWSFYIALRLRLVAADIWRMSISSQLIDVFSMLHSVSGERVS